MTMNPAGGRPFQFSLRSLLIATAVLACLLVPVAWVARQREAVLRARDEALRAVVWAERYRAELRAKDMEIARFVDSGPAQDRHPESRSPALPAEVSPLIDRLRRENAELKATVERLRRQVEQLEAARGR
jgi:hypothetical protein